MIRVPIGDISAAVDAGSPHWRTRAAAEQARNRTAGRHVGRSIWSNVKPILVDAQAGKCAYCERQLGSSGYEWDVEHFRPKGKVDSWAPQTTQLRDVGGDSAIGYHLLAYEPFNYLVACKPCNSGYKKNFFPTGAARQLTTTEPTLLRAEAPYIVNPLDSAEPDPEVIITFDGLVPVPVNAEGPERMRALVTIELLGLTREDLIRERARVVIDVWMAFSMHISPMAQDKELADRALGVLLDRRSPHAGCARAFFRLCQRNIGSAESLFEEALSYLEDLLRGPNAQG